MPDTHLVSIWSLCYDRVVLNIDLLVLYAKACAEFHQSGRKEISREPGSWKTQPSAGPTGLLVGLAGGGYFRRLYDLLCRRVFQSAAVYLDELRRLRRICQE